MAQNIKKGSISYREYNEKFRLPEQARDEQLLLSKKHYALCYEPGKGKSYPIIHCIQEVNKLKKGKASLLIMSDSTCIRDMWKSEIEPQGLLPAETYMVTDRTAIGVVKEALLGKKWDIIVIDECQSLRSGITRAKSQYAKLVYQLSKKAEYVWGMTGTIAGNNNIEPFCVLHALHVAGLGDINCQKFKKCMCINELQYGPFGAFEKPVRLNEAGEKMMAEAYHNGCSFWEYNDTDEMPPMNIQVVKLPVESTLSYKNALQGILQCDDHESTTLKAIAMQKAQQALNGFLYYEENGIRNTYIVPDYVNPKLSYITEHCKKDRHIIAYRFQEDCNKIELTLDRAGISHCNQIKDFKSNSNISVLVLQCSRGKAANIQVCKNIIYYTADFSFINYKQLIHRCWRRGQDEPCFVTFLVNEVMDEYHVEQKIWTSLRNKQNIHDLLMSIKYEVEEVR